MATPPLPFKKGKRVRFLSGPFEMLWVQLEQEIEGFRPASLEIIEYS